jgi:tetratricopeptide (TPR) repeat protein
MPESHRLKSGVEADRGTRTEALLVEGLDHYLAGKFEDAIHIWTRVLFLDRSHARARAYIDRARTAIAERQRASDEMLHATSEMLTRGDAAEARRLLDEILNTGGDDERAAELRVRIERLERASELARPVAMPVPSPEVVPAATSPTSGFRRLRTAAVIAVVVLVAGLAAAPTIWDLFGLDPVRTPLMSTAGDTVLPVLSTSDVALVRARTLYSRGRLAEALRVLDRVTDISGVPAANQLRVEIQQALLASGTSMRRQAAAQSAATAGRE